MNTTKPAQASTTGANVHSQPRSLRSVSSTTLVGILVWFAAALLYSYTAGPGIVKLFDDSLEFQTVAPTFGIAHPTGYPLYTLAGGLWSRILFPFGNWAWRMNIFSALTAATTVLLVYLIAIRLLPRTNDRLAIWIGLSASAAFALGPVWWSQATMAEVYALHNMLLAAILLVTLTIPSLFSGEESLQRRQPAFRRILLLCVLIGLSLAHHRTGLLILPGVALFLLWSVPGLWRPRKEWLFWFAGILLPLALYLYLPVRASQGAVDLNGSYVNTFAGFLNHAMARQYSSFFVENPLGSLRSPHDLVDVGWRQFGLLSLLLAGVGLVSMPFVSGHALRRWSLLIFVLAANLAFASRYLVADWEVFLIPAFLVLSLFVGVGVGILAGLRRSRPTWHTAASLTALVVLGLAGRGAPINRHDDWETHQYAYLLGSVAYPSHSRVIGLEGETTALKYMQASLGLARDAIPVTANDPTQREQLLADSVSHNYPTYITRELPGIEKLYSFSGEGPLVRVWPRGQMEATDLAHALNRELLDGRLRLQGYELQTLNLPGGPVLELTLGWLPANPLNRTIKVSLRLIDDQGSPVVDSQNEPVIEDRFPVHQAAPSTVWLPQELVRDVHYVSLPQAQKASAIQIIVYDADTAAELDRFEIPVP